MAEENENIVEITDEDGNKIEIEILDILTVDNVEYALLLPKNQEHKHDETCECDCEEEVVLMRLKRDGEEFIFEQIEDDDEFEKVSAYIEELEDEIDD